jgi:hypothetical protein
MPQVGIRLSPHVAPAPSALSASVNGTSLTISFSEPVAIANTSGISLTGTTSTIQSVDSGSGTDTVILTLSPPVVADQTVVVVLSSATTITSVAMGTTLRAGTVNAANNTPFGPLWSDLFQRNDGPIGNGWQHDGNHTGATITNHLVRPDEIWGDTLGRTFHPAGGAATGDIRMTASFASRAFDFDWYGIIIRYNPATLQGIKLFYASFNWGWHIGSAAGVNTGNGARIQNVPENFSSIALEIDSSPPGGAVVRAFFDGVQYGEDQTVASIAASSNVTAEHLISGSAVGFFSTFTTTAAWGPIIITNAGTAPP